MTPLGVLILVCAIGILLMGGIFTDLRHVMASIRRGADDGYRNFVSPEGVRLLNVQPEDQGRLLAAGWVPEELVLPVSGATRGGYASIHRVGNPAVGARPLHRNFGLSRAGQVYPTDDVAYHSPLESQRWTGDDLLVPGTAKPIS